MANSRIIKTKGVFLREYSIPNFQFQPQMWGFTKWIYHYYQTLLPFSQYETKARAAQFTNSNAISSDEFFGEDVQEPKLQRWLGRHQGRNEGRRDSGGWEDLPHGQRRFQLYSGKHKALIIKKALALKCTCTQKKIFWYVKGTQFRSPLHQHSVENIHQVMK